jgi:hypothetical protein
MSETQVALFLDSLRAMLSELEALAIPTVAIVDGFAMGGGTELALGCDLRVGGQLFGLNRSVAAQLTCRLGHQARAARDETGHHPRRRRHTALDASCGRSEGEGTNLYGAAAGGRRGRTYRYAKSIRSAARMS